MLCANHNGATAGLGRRGPGVRLLLLVEAAHPHRLAPSRGAAAGIPRAVLRGLFWQWVTFACVCVSGGAQRI